MEVWQTLWSDMQITAESPETDQNHAFDLKKIFHNTAKWLHSTSFFMKYPTESLVKSERLRDWKLKENACNCTMVTNCKSPVGQSTTFHKDFSNIHLKDVNNQHDARSWYHRMAASIEIMATGSPTRNLFVGYCCCYFFPNP